MKYCGFIVWSSCLYNSIYLLKYPLNFGCLCGFFYWKGTENIFSTVHGSVVDGIECSDISTSEADAGIRRPSDGLQDNENSDCFKFPLEKVILSLPPAFRFSTASKPSGSWFVILQVPTMNFESIVVFIFNQQNVVSTNCFVQEANSNDCVKYKFEISPNSGDFDWKRKSLVMSDCHTLHVQDCQASIRLSTSWSSSQLKFVIWNFKSTDFMEHSFILQLPKP